MEFPMSRNLLAIRIWLILMVLASSLTGTSAFAQSAGTVVRVDPSTVSAKVNDSINLTIKVDNVANLTAMELHLSFNPSVLEVTGVTNGGFVAADFTAQNVFDNSAGTIDYAIAQLNRSPAQGSGTLLNIAFRAKTNGNSTVTVRATQAAPSGLLLADQNGASIQASWAAGSVNVGSTTSVSPTPVTPTPVTPTPVTPSSVSPTPVTPTPVTPTPVTPTPVTPTSIPIGGTLGTHVVRFGESLYCIGRAYKVSPWAIADKNGVWWPYMIFPNQRLLIPNVAWSPIPSGPTCQAQFTASNPTSVPTATPVTPGAPTATPIAPTATAVPSGACRTYYVVRPGDTLYRIAVWYGVSYMDIARVNHIPNPRLIYSGQQLCIP
jgi:LysM repeat protein